MTTWGSATSPVTSISDVTFGNNDSIYVPANTTITMTGYGAMVPQPVTKASQSGLSWMNFSSGAPATITFATSSNGTINLTYFQGLKGKVNVLVVYSYSHTIYYNANGGSGSMSATSITDYNSGNTNVTSAGNGFTPPAGHYFTGWKLDNTGTIYGAGTQFAVAGNTFITLYAQWAKYTYTVTIASNNTGYGTVSPTSITGVPYGSSISVNSNKVTINGTTSTATAASATAQYSYAFSSWSNTSGTITANRTITANFTRSTRNYTATIAASPSGYGSVSPTSITKAYNSAISNSGNTVTVGGTTSTATPTTATAQYSYAFSSWTNGTGNLTANRTITANFTRTLRSYNVSLGVNPANTGTTSGAGSYNYGATATISATSTTGYHFVNWSDNVSTNPRSFTVTGAVSLTANFAINQYTVSLAVDPASTGTVTGAGTYNHGTSVTIKATPNASYKFVNWSDGSTSATRTFNITGNVSLTAYFELDAVQVTGASNGNGSVTGSGTYNIGSTATLTAVPDAHYKFINWDDGTTANPKSFTVTQAVTYTATFGWAYPNTPVKVNGNWVDGTMYVKVNGNWVQATKVWIKDNGTWKESTLK